MKNTIYFLFLLAFVIVSCKNEKVQPNPNQNITSTFQSEIYFYGESANDTLKWEAGINGDKDIAGIGTGKGNEYSSSFLRTPALDNISIKFILPQSNPTLADYNSFFKPCLKYYKQENTPDGVFFYHVDANGDLWSTVLGDQTNSLFTITEVGKIQFNGSNYSFVKATFNCMLYKQDNSSMKQKNGMVKCLIPLY